MHCRMNLWKKNYNKEMFSKVILNNIDIIISCIVLSLHSTCIIFLIEILDTYISNCTVLNIDMLRLFK